MKHLLHLLLITLLFGSFISETTAQIKSAGFHNVDITQDLCDFIDTRGISAEESYDIIVDLLAPTGLVYDGRILECQDFKGKAVAFIKDGVQYIAYDGAFLSKIKDKNNWAAKGILAHELAHHLRNHDMDEDNRKLIRLEELEADEWAGFALAKLGANEYEAVSMLDEITHPSCESERHASHPCRSKRREAILRGWQTAQSQKPQTIIQEKIVQLDDRDGDGLSNAVDNCPDEAGPVTNFGCPAKDSPKEDSPRAEYVDSFIEDVSTNMVKVEGGTFKMGCTSEQGSDCDEDKSPVHSVTLSSYYLSKYEVTQAQWEHIMGSTPSEFSGCSLCPVEKVSWEEVQEFIIKLNRKYGTEYRLPTESEWEYASREGEASKGYKYSGSDDISSVAWYDSNSSSKTHLVGTKAPNELGIYDMSGNVYEWCSDRYGDYTSDSSRNPKGASSGGGRVLRGGGWSGSPGSCRVANRSRISPGNLLSFLGFRLASPSLK